MVTPTDLSPGGSMFVMVLQGSFDDGLYNNPFNPNPTWYAVTFTPQTGEQFRIYPASVSQVAVGNMDLVTFRFPQDIGNGTYILAPLDANEAQHPSPMMLNGGVTADFTFHVK